MKIQKFALIVGGPILILAILGYRFGYFNFPNQEKKLSASSEEPLRTETSVKKSQTPPKEKTESTLNPASSKVAVTEKKVVKSKSPTAAPVDKITSEKERPTQTIVKEEVALEPPPPSQPTPPKSMLGKGDPFSYASGHDEDFGQSIRNISLGEIEIKGIIRLEKDTPIAILHVKNEDRLYYVKKGSVIRIHRPSKTNTYNSESYIAVKNIRDDEVELILQDRPDRLIIVR